MCRRNATAVEARFYDLITRMKLFPRQNCLALVRLRRHVRIDIEFCARENLRTKERLANSSSPFPPPAETGKTIARRINAISRYYLSGLKIVRARESLDVETIIALYSSRFYFIARFYSRLEETATVRTSPVL